MCLLRTTYLSTPTWTTREGKWTLWYSAVSASLSPRINTICETKRHRQSKQSVVIGGVHWPVCLCNVSSLLGTAWTWCLSCPPFGHRYCDEYTTIEVGAFFLLKWTTWHFHTLTSLNSLRLRKLLTFGYLWLSYLSFPFFTFPYLSLPSLTFPYLSLSFLNLLGLTHKGSFVLLGLLITRQVVCWPAIGPL